MPLSFALMGSSILASLTTRKTYKRWIWFTFWSGLAIAILMVLAAASEIDIGFLTVALFDLEKVAQGLAVLYTGISVLLLGISEFLARRKR